MVVRFPFKKLAMKALRERSRHASTRCILRTPPAYRAMLVHVFRLHLVPVAHGQVSSTPLCPLKAQRQRNKLASISPFLY